MSRVRHSLEYAGLRLALGLVDRFPLRTAAAWSSAMAGLWYSLDRPRRRIAVANVLRAAVASTEREADRIARASFRHFAVSIVEGLKAETTITAANWQEHVRLEMPESARETLQRPGQGVILVSGHLGSWAVAGHAVSFLKPVVGISRGLNNPHTDRLLQTRRPNDRFSWTPKHGANTFRFLSVLKAGKILALLVDQHARDQGIMLDFLGTPASTHVSPALLHLVTGAPLCYGYCVRTGPMVYALRVAEPLHHPASGDKERDIRDILETVHGWLGDAVRQYPEQYLWAHRRWKQTPAPAAQKTASTPARNVAPGAARPGKSS